MIHTCYCGAAGYPHSVGTAGCRGSSRYSSAEPRCGTCGGMSYHPHHNPGESLAFYICDACGGDEIYSDARCRDLLQEMSVEELTGDSIHGN